MRHASSAASELPSETEHARSNLSKSLTTRIDKLQTSILFAGQRLNDLTGYSGIEKLKKQIEFQEQNVLDSLQRVRDAKKAYEQAIRTRSESQKEVNELLQRKSSWSPSDLERFTTLFRNDHSNSQQEVVTQQELTDAEIKADQARTELGNMILARYHEEQIWSDKIRRASTWGTWGLMGFNILLFVIVQLGLEPWKRKRLVANFEEKVRQVVNEERGLAIAATTNSSDDATFLTDADHAAQEFQHQLPDTRIGFESVSAAAATSSDSQSFTATPEPSYIPSEPLKNSDSIGMADPTNLENAFEETEQLEELAKYPTLDRPVSGTSSMFSMPPSIHQLHHSLQSLFKKMEKTIHGMLSQDRSGMRVEDVTVSCLLSAVVGIGIGIALGTT